jgi:glycerophosphoryl diester phosphodiesterase
MRGSWLGAAVLACAGVAFGVMAGRTAAQGRSTPELPWLIAHRGASAHAPENTVPAFTLAVEQGAAFVEFDLRYTKDRRVVCLHDDSLERTTNVEEVFPDRARPAGSGAAAKVTWLLEDFTLAELRKLDAGSWFSATFAGTRIPTFGETIEALRGRSGLYIELKSPEKYPGIERAVMDELKANGLDVPGASPRTPVLIQSFTASSLELLAKELRTTLPIHFLVGTRDAESWVTPEGLARVKAFATGLSPEKAIVLEKPGVVKDAKRLGLLVTPYTFRASSVGAGFPDVRAEMAHYIEKVGVDGVITDNPDQMPARAARTPGANHP